MMKFAQVVDGGVVKTGVVSGTCQEGIFYSFYAALEAAGFYPQLDVIPVYDALTEQVFITDYVVEASHVNAIYTASPRSAEEIFATKHKTVEAIEAHHDAISKQPVLVAGVNYKGGWESAAVIDGLADTKERMSGSACTVYDAAGLTHSLSIEDTRSVAASISVAYELTFAAKTAALLAALSATNQSALDASLSGFVQAYPA